MAKALFGYATATDPRVATRLAGENRVLRQRIADLEDALHRLQQENDALAEMVHFDTGHSADEVLELA